MNLLSNYKPLFKKNPDTRYFLITGGRGSGKSYSVALSLLNLTYEPDNIILFTRWTMISAHISIIPEFLEKIEVMGVESDFDITQNEIVNNKTGSKILFRGIKTSQGTATANLKSISGVTTWVLDEAEELVDEDIFDRIDLSIRAKDIPNRVMLVMNPSFKSHWIYKRWMISNRIDTTYIHTTYLQNKENLSQSFIDQAKRTKVENLHRYEHLFLGKWLDDAEGMLWNRQIIERSRMPKAPDLERIVVAIDPAATANMDSDETGIVVVGKDKAGNGYVLEDLSGKYSPSQWGALAVKAKERWDADCIVAEKNQGGDMVESVIRSMGERYRVKLVTATKGKYVRAEPVYSFYEQGKIYHIGQFPILESQMITFDPEKGKSPDRVDALVWGFTELIVNTGRSAFGIVT
jgi:predicted phage terminase large subunit-like protein